VPVTPNAVPGELGLLSSLRILLVEDDDDGRDYFAFALSRQDATVTAVGSAADALEAFGRACPDVLVSDIGLPDEDGCELIRRVRGLGGVYALMPAVAVTAFTDAETRARVLEAGFQVYLDKPVGPTRLVAAVAGIVERVESLRRLASEIEVRYAGNLAELTRMRKAVNEGRRLAAESCRRRERARPSRRPPERAVTI
jgi:DNA-binding response OmpR family regulator